MALALASRLGSYLLQELPKTDFLAPIVTGTKLQLVRHRRTKHYDPKWKKFRRLKVIKVKLPNFNENPENFTEEEMRSKLKERGVLPPRPWIERQFYLACTGGTFEPYVPPEGDGKVSSITAQGAKQKLQFLEKKTKTIMAIRKIGAFEDDFDTSEFCKHAEEIYIKAHETLAKRDKEALSQYVTEKALPQVFHNVSKKTINWKFLKSIELPRIVHARCTDIITKENIFAQLTVRFHTQQILAVYDRFGRLLHGSEILAKDVLEYVVFEKHLSNEYGVWRIHDKIIPDWLPPREPMRMTFKKLPELEALPEKASVEPDKTKQDVELPQKPSGDSAPALA